MSEISLLIADDHADVRAGLRMRLRHEPDFRLVGEAKDSTEAIKLATLHQPKIVLIEPLMQDNLGVFAIKQIIQRLPQTSVVALTIAADTLLRMTLREVGVQHVLEKGIESPLLIQTLRAVI